MTCSSSVQSQDFCSIEFSSFKMKLLTSVPESSPGSPITPQEQEKKQANYQKRKRMPPKRKQLLSNLTLLVLISDLLHCCTDDFLPQTSNSPKWLLWKQSLKNNQNFLCFIQKTATRILELKFSWHLNQNENGFVLLQW